MQLIRTMWYRTERQRHLTESVFDGEVTHKIGLNSAMHVLELVFQASLSHAPNRIGDQLVDLRDFQTILLKPGNWSCRVTTVWGRNPAVRGVFHAYKNAMGNRVYSWNGEKEVTVQP